MPELPEVETVARCLRATVVGARIGRIVYASRRVAAVCPPRWRADVRGRVIRGVSRRGKYLIFALTGDRHLVLHLRMTGRLRLAEPQVRWGSHDRLILALSGGRLPGPRQLVLVDTRQFARIMWWNQGPPLAQPPLSRLGPEATDLTDAILREIVSCSRRSVKSLLLDQTRIAGLGNIYVDESLHLACIHPAAISSSLSRQRVHRLRGAIDGILRAAIAARGTTFDTFSDLSGRGGGFAPRLAVYGRSGQSCHRCGKSIQRITLGGRGTFFCRRCQRPPRSATSSMTC
ncbi:MAG TPA: bifunctional DNA-formamidopyrimidine glycosylase/DNA-(apurinic or apyrimidinic site) lyase [Acidobacteriota bacterium]|nr:bifunctional DNA-formamidopyrimidine glycosylase/DNA-(apurinic or apyrimidinic site) lyase [Acidobacteriota bacterium]